MDTYHEEMELEEELDVTCDNFMQEHPFASIGMMSEDTVKPNQKGRPSNKQKRARDRGVRLRDNIRDRLEDSGLTHPTGKYYSERNKYNRPTNFD